ncbi:major facilitator superfamily transporter [Ceratobasidium sp. AG-Ba]|nr:major facilitator superfamily transporter [Ceratobasidium sp. AG-Ba]
MASSTLTLPVDALSATRASFSKSRERVASPSPSARARHPHDQEAIEMDALGTPKEASVSSTAPDAPVWTMSTKKEWTAISACFLCLFMAGWNDATTGPLLPTIQSFYHINFTVVSMLFVSNFVGFISAAVANVFLNDRFGFGKVILLGGLLQVVAYCLLAPALPFPVMCIAYAINGFGIALQDAQANGFVAALPNNASAKMGLLHAAYGAGAFVSPLIATQFAQIPRWSFHYLTSLGFAIANAITLLVVFRLRTQDEILEIPSAHTDAAAHHASGQNKYKQIFGSWAVQLMALFAWVYVGTEVTIGGMDGLLLGFFGGLMLGRVVLLWVNEKVGERRVIYLYSILAIGLELVVWLVPNIIGNGVAVSLIGLLLGRSQGMFYDKPARIRLILEHRPFYPIAMNVTGEIVPKWILTGSIGWIASFGQAGSAVFPFMTGALAQKHGVKVLQPV